MTVFRRRRPDGKDRVYSYEFVYQGLRYRGSTGQLDKEAATKWELAEKERVRRVAGGLEAPKAVEGMRFQEWAEEYFEIKSREVRRPDRLELILRCVLRFWGAKPAEDGDVAIDPTAPYHDLRMTDVVRDPYWLERFEQWLRETDPTTGKPVRSPQTRNHYRSGVSQMFAVASRYSYQKLTGVTSNPFATVPREKRRKRTVTITPSDLRKLLSHASSHVRLALAIGALAPTMRYASILSLRWDQLNKDWTQITVHDHKTQDTSHGPQIVPVSEQLRTILKHTKLNARHRSKYVVTYRGKRVSSIRDGVRAAALAAKVKYGRGDGFTFHSLRHTAPSLLSGHGVNAFVLRDLLGHADVATTGDYTHIVDPMVAQAAETLSSLLPVSDVVTASRLRAKRPKRGGENGGDSRKGAKKKPSKTARATLHARTQKQQRTRVKSAS